MRGGFLEQRIVELEAVRAVRVEKAEAAARRGRAVQQAEQAGGGEQLLIESRPAVGDGSQRGYGGERVHVPISSRCVSDVKASISELTLTPCADIIPFMARKQTAPAPAPEALPPPHNEALFARLDLCARRSDTTLSALAESLGFSSGRLFNHKDRHTVPAWEILRAFKRRFGVTVDWIVDGDESGLTVAARTFLGL